MLSLATGVPAATVSRSVPPPANFHPELRAIAAAVSPGELQATLTHLVGFGTRHTLSDTRSQTRGIGAARRWVKARFEQISNGCGGCLTIVTPAQSVTGERIPRPTEVQDVVAILHGTMDPDRVIVITGHLDSRVTDVMNSTADAPGADDDGSGTAAVIEAARVLSQHRFPATLVFGVDSGEEQGLYGGKVLADYAVAHGWRVEADLNNDIIGGIRGQDGVIDNTSVRLFAESLKNTLTPRQIHLLNYTGGELDSPSRNLARFIARLAPRYVNNFHVRLIYRTDRYRRGGDQVEFLNAGYPAVRFTERSEDYTHEHQDVRVVDGVQYGDVLSGVNFPYLAKVTALNAAAMAALANAPAPPEGVSISGAVTVDTGLHWQPVPGAVGYYVWWRETTAPQWQHKRWIAADAATHDADGKLSFTLHDANIDDWFFGVSSVSADGYASPVVFPGPNGDFARSGAVPVSGGG
ncbi:MAG: M20/M25/M40 family metallo-hydrolase [Gammaproteobacteria bacterium]|nr:M20/M25/M40 family metallo-hydrolase [Gammaproteobacteria bacterium]